MASKLARTVAALLLAATMAPTPTAMAREERACAVNGVVYTTSNPPPGYNVPRPIGGRLGSGGESYRGTDGPDFIVGSDRGDLINGEGGPDILCGRGGNDFINGGDGDDVIKGGPGDDTLSGDSGDDRIKGGAGNDGLGGGLGDDQLDGKDGADTILEVLDGRSGGRLTLTDGRLVGHGTDTFVNIEGARLIGSLGNDVFDASGFGGGVFLIGNDGDDTLIGGRGDDWIYGDDFLDNDATGDDTLDGGLGNNFLDGGTGIDACVNGGRFNCER